MTEVSSGSAPYIYVATRMRVRRAKLIPKEEYQRMLNMGLPEFIRLVEDMEYKREIDELSSIFSGVDLIESATSWNLAKEYQRVISLAPGEMKGFTRDYLRKWDIQNVLTILRGKLTGLSKGKIRYVLVPAGELDAAFLDKLLAENSLERIVEMLPDRHMADIITEGIAKAKETKSSSHIENELYKYYYTTLLKAGHGTIKGSTSFLKYVTLEIDCQNISTLARLRAQGNQQCSTLSMWIDGGTYTPDELERLTTVESNDEVIDALKKKMKSQVLLDLFEEARGNASSDVRGKVISAQLAQMIKVSKREPFSISPLLVYLECKKYEVDNLRALARGKEAGLEPEVIAQYLVM